MASQAGCERCFEAYVVIFTYIFRCSGLTLLLESFAEMNNDSVAGF